MPPELSMNLPTTLRDVTAETLTSMLEVGFPGTEVTHVTIGKVLPGTCTKIRLLLEYNDTGHTHGLPPTMCLKGGFESHGLTGQVYPREVWFYQQLARQIGNSLPKCFFAGRSERQAVILMEDLLARNVRFARACDAATVAQMQSLLGLLAAVHGRYWESRDLDAVADEPPRESGSAVLDFSNLVLYQPDNFQRMMQLPRTAAVPGALRNLDSARRYLTRLIAKFDYGPRCLMHGDAHLGNTFYPQRGGDSGFIDWQTYARGHWAFDVSHLLCTGLTPEMRRRHERSLLEHYLGELGCHGGRVPHFTDAWESYRQMAFYGFAWALCPPELQAEEVCVTCAERVIAAITDLETLEALDR